MLLGVASRLPASRGTLSTDHVKIIYAAQLKLVAKAGEYNSLLAIPNDLAKGVTGCGSGVVLLVSQDHSCAALSGPVGPLN